MVQEIPLRREGKTGKSGAVMKIRVLAAITLSTCLAIAADPVKLDKLTLKNGREYEKVTITEKRADGISISHESGTARIKFEDLPEDIVKQLGGFDAEAAVKARAETDAKEEAARAEIEKGMADMADEKQSREQNAAIAASAQHAELKITQVVDGGVLCKIALFTNIKEEVVSKDAFGRDVISYKTVPTMSEFSNELHFVVGVTGVVDGQRVSTSLIPAGTYEYTKVTGAGATVSKWKAIKTTAITLPPVPEPTSRRYIPTTPPPVSRSRSIGGG